MPKDGRQTNLQRKSLNFDAKSPPCIGVWGSVLESQPETGRARTSRLLFIVGISAFVIWVGTGCYSMKNIREFSIGFGGVDAEFYEAKEPKE